MNKKNPKKASVKTPKQLAKLLNPALVAKKKAFASLEKELSGSLFAGKNQAAISILKDKQVVIMATANGGKNNPKRDIVDPLVVQAIGLAAMVQNAPTQKLAALMNGNEELNLAQDLNLKLDEDLQRLADEYTDISKSFGGQVVGQVEAKNAKTVKAAIDLVHKMANQKN